MYELRKVLRAKYLTMHVLIIYYLSQQRYSAARRHAVMLRVCPQGGESIAFLLECY